MADNSQKTTTALIILDGFGYREAPEDNAIHHANTPVWDQLWSERSHTLISGSGLDVGLPEGQMGNSEVGHMSLGAGRIIYQNITRIDKAIADGEFDNNPVYVDAIDKAVSAGNTVHILGLLSPGGVHSHENHIHAAVRLAAKRGAKQISVHAFLDGRDTPPRSAKPSLEKLEALYAELGCGKTATICGRFYAMDRDERWDRVEKAWQCLTANDTEHKAPDAVSALEAAYERGEDDEFVAPTVIGAAGNSSVIADGDAVLFMNFRADRAREISRAFCQDDFHGFERQQRPKLAAFVTTTEYAGDIPAPCAFPPSALHNSFGEIMAKTGRSQLRIAETEKYAHVTFFFSGGKEALFDGEERELIPSPKVETYDLKPEMSAPEVTDRLVEAIESRRFDTIICNYANGDMVGHTGNFDAAVKAVETLDECLGRVVAALEATGGQCLITADHGNCEQMVDYDAQQAHTQHTTEHVPLVYVGPEALEFVEGDGRLPDVAPTLLGLMSIDQPEEMTGRNLLKPSSSNN